jgi:hypothetical protein
LTGGLQKRPSGSVRLQSGTLRRSEPHDRSKPNLMCRSTREDAKG